MTSPVLAKTPIVAWCETWSISFLRGSARLSSSWVLPARLSAQRDNYRNTSNFSRNCCMRVPRAEGHKGDGAFCSLVAGPQAPIQRRDMCRSAKQVLRELLAQTDRPYGRLRPEPCDAKADATVLTIRSATS